VNSKYDTISNTVASNSNVIGGLSLRGERFSKRQQKGVYDCTTLLFLNPLFSI